MTPAERERAETELSKSDIKRLEADDLAELLAATNAKRRARGKAELTSQEVEGSLIADELARRPSGPSRWDGI